MDLLYKMRHRDTTGQIRRQLCIHPLHIIRTMAHSKALAVWWCLTLWFMILLQLATSRRDFSQLSKVKLNLRKYSASQMVLPRSTRIEKTLLILLTMRRITEYQQNGISLPHHTAKVRVTELVVQWKDLRPRLACKEHLTQIQTPHQLYEWAQDNIAGVTTIFCPKGDIAEHETFLKARLETSITVAGTQKLHAFYSIHGRHQLVVKRYSNSGESRTANVVKV